MRLPVTMTSDFVCPRCFIGERHLFGAIKSLPTADVQVDLSYRPSGLNPDMPPGGMDRRDYRMAKFGNWACSQAMDAGKREVRALVTDAYRRSIQGVPLFEIGGMAISGAQSVAVIADAQGRAAVLQAAAA